MTTGAAYDRWKTTNPFEPEEGPWEDACGNCDPCENDDWSQCPAVIELYGHLTP